MKVAIMYEIISCGAPDDEMDTEDQALLIKKSLKKLGHEYTFIPFSIDIKKVIDELRIVKPDLIFNLVESVEGDGRLVYLATALFDYLNIPYTGCKTDAMFLSANKPLQKRILSCNYIRTIPWFTFEYLKSIKFVLPEKTLFIIKSTSEHASVWYNEKSVVEVINGDELYEAMAYQREWLGSDCYAEKFIDGREINIALIEVEGKPEFLHPIEFIFDEEFTKKKLRILDYISKWSMDSFEYIHTPRNFIFSVKDREIIREMEDISIKCWDAIGLNGYARVDFRVDNDNIPWVVEINPNPCISLHSEYIASANEIGMESVEVIDKLIKSALQGEKK